MALPNYPNNPSVNDTFVNGGVTFQWDGEKWKALSNANNTLTAQLADPDSTVLVGGVEAGNLVERQIDVRDFGVVGDNVTDDYANLVSAIDAANTANAYLHFPQGYRYNLNGNTLTMPRKISGHALFTGDLLWQTVKEVSQKGQVRTAGEIRLSGVWYSQFDYIESSGDMTFDGANPSWGTFWNQFSFVRCAELVLDLDQGQSVNQNMFSTVRCAGLRIKGDNTTGVREAHNNIFVNIDTTGADMTAKDGTTGCHVLNDSDSNQTNTLMNWYSEVSGRRIVKGNWMVLGANVDATNNPIMVDRNNSTLLCRNIGRLGNYLAAATNACRGGDWSELGATGLPLSMATSQVSQVTVTDSPDGNKLAAQQSGGSSFKAINIIYPLTTSPTVNATLFVKETGSPSNSVEIRDGAAGLESAGVASKTPLGDGWSLIRIKGSSDILDEAGGRTTGIIRLFTTTSDALTAGDTRAVGSYFVTTEDTALLPSVKSGPKTCYSTAPPTGGNWSVGDETINTSPVAGGTYKWVCVTAGSPGTWKAVGAIEV